MRAIAQTLEVKPLAKRIKVKMVGGNKITDFQFPVPFQREKDDKDGTGNK